MFTQHINPPLSVMFHYFVTVTWNVNKKWRRYLVQQQCNKENLGSWKGKN